MSKKPVMTSRRSRKLGPIGTVGAMITASLVTMVGIACGLEPQVILLRAGVSAVVMGGTLAFGLGVIQLANLPAVGKQRK